MKIESVKLDFKEKAQAKVGSLENAHHVPGGGNVKVRGQPSEKRLLSLLLIPKDKSCLGSLCSIGMI